MSRKIITVFGATGNQGGSVIDSILASPELSTKYKVRAVTRDDTKASASALKQKGVEVVKANLDDKESLAKAVEGASIVFGVTNYVELLDADLETAQGKNLVDAVKHANVDRFIFSSLPYVTKETNGRNTQLDHFDSKARVEEYARKLGVPGTYYLPGAFMSLVYSSLVPDDQGVYVWRNVVHEDTKIPLVDANRDTGKYVAAIIENLDSTLNARVLGTTEFITPAAIVAQFEEVTGHKARYERLSPEEFESMVPAAIAKQLRATFELMETEYYLGEPADGVQKSVQLVEQKSSVGKLTRWRDYVQAQPLK